MLESNFSLNQLFYVASTSWVISDNTRKDFLCFCRSWCVLDIATGLMMSHCPLGCLLGWVWHWVVLLAVGIHRIGVWGGLLLGSSCTVRRVLISFGEYVFLCHFRISGYYITTWLRIFRVGGIIFLYKSFFMVSSRRFTKVFHSLFQRCLILCLVGK